MEVYVTVSSHRSALILSLFIPCFTCRIYFLFGQEASFQSGSVEV